MGNRWDGKSQEERFWSYVNKSGDCWLWTGALDANGYGVARYDSRVVKAHRASWFLAGREIPSGLELDHLCRTPACVRTDHLEAVTHAENMRRWIRLRPPATHCKRGHELSGWNELRHRNGARQCRQCLYVRNNANSRRYRQAAKANNDFFLGTFVPADSDGAA